MDIFGMINQEVPQIHQVSNLVFSNSLKRMFRAAAASTHQQPIDARVRISQVSSEGEKGVLIADRTKE
jgi:hypothetical protein